MFENRYGKACAHGNYCHKRSAIVTDSWEQELLQDIPQRARNQSGQEAGKRENLGKSLYCGYHGENLVTKLSGLSGISIG